MTEPEATYQAQAERDAGGGRWLDGVERRAEATGGGFYLVPAADWLGVLDCFRMGERLLAAAERERDEARQAIAQILRGSLLDVRAAAFGPTIGVRYTEKIRAEIADAVRRLEDVCAAALAGKAGQ